MTAEPQKKRCTPEEYLVREEAAEYKSEYWNGEVFAMAGASAAHNQIVMNLTLAIGVFLEGKKCSPFNSDNRVEVREVNATLYTYPDLTIVCGQPRFSEETKSATLLNPTILIEVLSPSTGWSDRRHKTRAYRLLPSLKECVLVSQDAMYAEVLRRSENGWLYEDYDGPDATFALRSIDFTCPLSRLYRDVEVPEPKSLEDHLQRR